jgi:hypothetical protein
MTPGPFCGDFAIGEVTQHRPGQTIPRRQISCRHVLLWAFDEEGRGVIGDQAGWYRLSREERY